MNISNNNFFGLKSTNRFIGLKDHSLIYNKLKNVLKNSNIASSNNNIDKLTLSKQASFKIKVSQMNIDDAVATASVKADQMVENVMFTNLIGGIVNSTIDESKTEIENSMKSYSSYISKLNDGTLDKNISFDDYADSESKKKYQSSSINIMNALVSQTDTPTKSEELKPIENAENIDTLKVQALELEHTKEAYSSYDNKIDHTPLNKNVSSNYYVNFETKKEHHLNSINIINTLVNKTDTSAKTKETKAQEIKPSENTESIDTRKKKALEQLENRIKKIVDNSVNNLNNIFKGISVSSPELLDNINEIKQSVTSLISSIKDINLNNTKNKSEFAESLKKIFENINKTQSTIRNSLYTGFKNIPGLNKDYLSKLTSKFQTETINNLKRSQYDINLIDSTFNSHS